MPVYYGNSAISESSSSSNPAIDINGFLASGQGVKISGVKVLGERGIGINLVDPNATSLSDLAMILNNVIQSMASHGLNAPPVPPEEQTT